MANDVPRTHSLSRHSCHPSAVQLPMARCNISSWNSSTGSRIEEKPPTSLPTASMSAGASVAESALSHAKTECENTGTEPGEIMLLAETILLAERWCYVSTGSAELAVISMCEN